MVCRQPSLSLRFTGTTPHGLLSAITLTQIHWNNTPRSVVSHHTHSDSVEQHPTVCRQPSLSLRFTGTTPHGLSSAITLTQIHWNNTPQSVVSHHSHSDSLEQHPTVCRQPSHSLRFTGTTPHGLSSAITLTQIHWNNTPRSVVSHHTHSDPLEQHPTVLSSAITLTQIHWNNIPRSVVSHHTHLDSVEQHPTVCRQPSHSLRFSGTTPPRSVVSHHTHLDSLEQHPPRSVVSHHTHLDSLEQHPTVCRQPSHSLRSTGITPHGLSSAITLTQIHWNNTPRSVVSHHTHLDSLEQHPTVCRQPSHSLRFTGTTPHSLSSAITLT